MYRRLTDKYLWGYIKNNPIALTESHLILFKIGKKEHLLKIQKGYLYARPLGYYAGLYSSELSQGQLDEMEGSVNILKRSNLVVNGVVIGRIEQLIDRVGINTPIMCFMMSKLIRTDLNEWKITFDQNLIEDFTRGNSSDYGILLIDGIKLKERIEILGVQCFGKMIEYTDEKFDIKDGILNAIFRKRLSYSYQQEFRIIFKEKLDLGESISVPIGDISEFSRILPISILRNGLFFQRHFN